MTDKILVAYATRAGSTVKIAETVGKVFADHESEVDVLPIDEVKDLSEYYAAVIGSPIRLERWTPEAVAFLEKHRDELAKMPVALFSVCMTLVEDTPENRAIVAEYTKPLYNIVKPVAVGAFAGAIHPFNLTLVDRFAVNIIDPPVGDFRDWDKIESWADEVYWMM